eukprot:6631414-Prymnesium_polylepis.1
MLAPKSPRETKSVTIETSGYDKMGLLMGNVRSWFSFCSKGVVLDEVQPGSLADKAGLQVGDVILTINEKMVNAIGAGKLMKASLNEGKSLRVT